MIESRVKTSKYVSIKRRRVPGRPVSLQSSRKQDRKTSIATPVRHPARPSRDSAPSSSDSGDGKSAKTTAGSLQGSGTAERITLRLGSGVYVKVKPHWPVSKIIDGFCKLTGAEKAGLSLTLQGCRLARERTIASLGVKENDCLGIKWFEKPEKIKWVLLRAKALIKKMKEMERNETTTWNDYKRR